MKLKKQVSLVLVLIMSLTFLAGCGNKGDVKEKGKNEKIKVALLFAGYLGDKSFNDSANEGVNKAKDELGIEVKVMESDKPADWESNTMAMASSGEYDLILAVSAQFEDILKKIAPEFPDQKFAIIDGVVKQDNVTSAIFAQNEGSFLAGAAATLFTQKTNIKNVNADKTIGWVGGIDIPVLQDFLTGYKQGAQYVDPDVKVLVSFAGSFTDPLKGKELSLAQYSQGADIIMNVASNTGNGILEAAKETGKYAIGVDLDQDGIYPGSILTSMLKRVDVASYSIVKSVVEDKFQSGKTVYMDVSNGGVGLTEMKVMKESLGSDFPEDIIDKVKEIEDKIKSGEIKVNSHPGFGKQE
ncbi:BMP family lipoprotein [Clostridium algidicarnis]|uniref:BMP family lipoprotein n=1 Tax=Clostridium algidicarnis TaxID=37659 RepID=UPI003FD8EBCA